MRTLVSVVTVLLVCSASVLSQESDSAIATGWQRSLIIDITTTQTSYSNSWVGGEAGSLNWVANLNGKASRQISPRFEYSSALRMSFGQTHTQDPETRQWSKPKKSTDLIDWEQVGRFTLHKAFDPYAAVRLESQFYDGKVAAKKLFFSPLKLTESIGLSRKLYEKDKDVITSRLGFGLRQIFKKNVVLDLNGNVLATVDSTLMDGGIESVSDVSLAINERLQYTGKLSLYKALFFSKSDESVNDYWKAVDVNWENQINASITKLISVSLYTQLLYDKEVEKRGRIKETLAIGFVFKLL